MEELFHHWPAEAGPVELWSGGPLAHLHYPKGESRYRSLSGWSREHPWLARYSWGKRYEIEQLSILPKVIWKLRRSGASVVYCGDPVLSWHLKRFQRYHGASVVFMNGMRLSPRWGNHLDGVHLLADPYLEEAHLIPPAERHAHFFAVPHFADTELFYPADANARRAARQEFGLPEENYLVLSVGPLGNVSGKRLDFLAREVSAADRRVCLVHAGIEEDGAADLRRAIQELLGSRVVFLGRVDRARMSSLYRAVDCYSLGSLAEPFSIAILEALASGLPVVHHSDMVMIWQSGAGGYPVSMLEPGEAAAVFSRLALDNQEQSRKSKAARNSALERYAAPGIAVAIARQLVEVRRLQQSRQ